MALDKFLREGLEMTRLKTEQCIYVRFNDDRSETRLKTEQCIYVRFNEDRSEYIILAVYADDLLIAGSTQKAFATFNQQIIAKYDGKDLGALVTILNMEVVRTKEGELFLSQFLYIQDVLGRYKTYLPGPSTRLNVELIFLIERWLDRYSG